MSPFPRPHFSEIPAAIRAYFARQEAAPKGPTSNRIYGTITGIRLCYNELSSIAGLFEALAEILEDPAETLQWLDLSNNKLTRIEAAELVKFPNLSSLNLHGNHISSLKDVKDLGVLSKLSKFTIHNNTWTLASDSSKPGAGAAAAGGGATAGSDGKAGDKTGAGSSSSAAAAAGAAGGSGPDSARDAHGGGEGKERAATYQRAVVRSLESAPFYREQLIWYLKDTLLKSLDNNPITVRDREGAVKWHSVHRPVKKEAAQDGEGA